jgi:D-erythrulose 1-phosphate 3-epimerase
MKPSYPRVHLAIDNCFASKRWTRPSEWMEVIRGLGLACIEASTDTECDPLYMGPEYIRDWVEEVRSQSVRQGLRVVNLYSGHGTYATLGLGHTDVRVRERFHHEWLKALLLMAEGLGAGAGFYCHAFNDAVLQDPSQYTAMIIELCDRFADLAAFAERHGNTTIGVEQMYSPHQTPWTIDGAAGLLRNVYARGGKPFYITIDTGHSAGQDRFRRPGEQEVRTYLDSLARGRGGVAGRGTLWLGPERCHAMIEERRRARGSNEELVRAILQAIDAHAYLFAEEADGDPYAWLGRLGCYSPIIHLQQTSGNKSVHRPFTAQSNATGAIFGDQVIKSLAASYRAPLDPSMPPRCADIYLTLEIFSATDSYNRDILHDLRESVHYWRRFIPEDGLALDQLPVLSNETVGSAPVATGP